MFYRSLDCNLRSALLSFVIRNSLVPITILNHNMQAKQSPNYASLNARTLTLPIIVKLALSSISPVPYRCYTKPNPNHVHVGDPSLGLKIHTYHYTLERF